MYGREEVDLGKVGWIVKSRVRHPTWSGVRAGRWWWNSIYVDSLQFSAIQCRSSLVRVGSASDFNSAEQFKVFKSWALDYLICNFCNWFAKSWAGSLYRGINFNLKTAHWITDFIGFPKLYLRNDFCRWMTFNTYHMYRMGLWAIAMARVNATNPRALGSVQLVHFRVDRLCWNCKTKYWSILLK